MPAQKAGWLWIACAGRSFFFDTRADGVARTRQQRQMRISPSTPSFVLHFSSLFHAGREFAFPCDEQGLVNLDAMPARIRNNYLYARAMLGREFAWPRVRSMHAEGALAE
jgi:hypothetical protein